MNKGETWLAIALMIKDEELTAKIDLYSMDIDRKEFAEPNKIDDLKFNVEFMDFSTDDFFLIYKLKNGDINYVDISDKTLIKNIDSVDKSVEWLGDGLKITNVIILLLSFLYF